MNTPLVIETLVLLGASAISIALVSCLRLPAMLGYLFAGIVMGPFGLDFVAASDGTRFLAELGLVLLMFMVGLEFSWAEMWAARRAVFLAGALQVLLTMSCATAVALGLGMPWPAATLAGGALAMGSTGLALEQLRQLAQLGQPHGRIATGVLLFQDMAALPFLVVIDSASAGDSLQFLPAMRQLLIAALCLGGLLWLGRPALRIVLAWISRSESTDLFLLSALLLALGTAFAAQRLDAAPTIGAFLAGIVVGESDLRHRVATHLSPFRDMLVGLFFVTVGMQVDLRALTASAPATLLWLVLILLLKPLLSAAAMRIARYPCLPALRAAVVLAHASELTLLILTQAMQARLVPAGAGQAMLVAAVLSMGLAPIIIQHNRTIAARAARAVWWLAAAPERIAHLTAINARRLGAAQTPANIRELKPEPQVEPRTTQRYPEIRRSIMATTQTQAGTGPDTGGAVNAPAVQRSTRPLGTQSPSGSGWAPGPFGLMRRLSDDMDRLFGQLVGGGRDSGSVMGSVVLTPNVDWVPSIELLQRNGQLVVQAELPGIAPEDINVEVADDVLTISGERREEVETDRDGFRRTERRYGNFSRAIALPEGVKSEEVRASFKDGVLEVAIPLSQPDSHRRTIKIQHDEAPSGESGTDGTTSH